jgi:hypothetical protein
MRPLALTAVLALLLAGCAGSPGEPTSDSGGALGEDVEVEVDSTGAIRGVVVDDAIRPLANVTVKLAEPERFFNTTASGTFSFSGLEPGTYFVEASKLGFTSARQSIEVVAGDRDPPVARMLLTADASTAPYYSEQKGTGYIVCTTSVVATCGAPDVVLRLIVCDVFQVCVGPVTGDTYGFYMYYEPNATMIQAEMVWESTQSLSTQLSLSMENIEGCEAASDAYQEGVTGDSPIYNIANETEVKAGTIGGTCGMFYSVFSGDTAGTPAGITVQQKFDIFSHAFYGYTPYDGWRFTEDPGVPTPP